MFWRKGLFISLALYKHLIHCSCFSLSVLANKNILVKEKNPQFNFPPFVMFKNNIAFIKTYCLTGFVDKNAPFAFPCSLTLIVFADCDGYVLCSLNTLSLCIVMFSFIEEHIFTFSCNFGIWYSTYSLAQNIAESNHIRLILGYWLCKIKFSRLMDFIYYYPKCFILTFESISSLVSLHQNRDTGGF